MTYAELVAANYKILKPQESARQLRGQAAIVYLPKYCILDKKTIARTAPRRHS